MAKKELKNIFLSASIPLPERDPKYFGTADIIAIRDSIIALATCVLPKHRIIWGGHPSITPLIYYVMQKSALNIQEHLILYQSKFFEKHFPPDNNRFNNIIQTKALETREESLDLMREAMLSSYNYSAGIFIGGMEGVEDEYTLFRKFNPEALILPIASTGAAAKILYDNLQDSDDELMSNYAYVSLFQKYLLDKI